MKAVTISVKPEQVVPYVLEALRRYWLVTFVFFTIGVVLGFASYARDVPPFVTYQATAVLGIAPVAASGITPACEAKGIPTLVRSPDVVGAAASRAARITASVETPTLVDVVGTAIARDDARNGANDAVKSVAAYCNDRINAALAAQVTALSDQLTAQRALLGKLDGTTLGSQKTSADASDLQKQIAALIAKKEKLQDAYVAQAIAAASASAALRATIPVAYAEINPTNKRWAALQKQYLADAALYDSVASLYKPTAPRVIDLGARVRTDLDTLAEIERTIDVPANLMMSASYAKAFAANQTAQDTADETTGQIALYDARIAALQAKMPKAFGPSPALLEAQRQSAIAQAAYSALAKQLADVSAEQAQLAANPAVVVAGNVTDDTVLRLGERLAIEFAAAVALAFLVLGILLAILIYVLDDRLVTTQQITKLYAKPVIATLKPKS